MVGLFDFLTGNKAADPAVPRQSRDALIAALMALNGDDRPWAIAPAEPGGKADLVAQWKYGDPRWDSYLRGATTGRGYRMLMRLDDASGTVRSVDQELSVNWSVSPPQVSVAVFRGQEIGMSKSMSFSFGEDAPTDSASTSFSTNDLKTPIRQAVADAGWGWHGVAFAKL